MNKPINVFFLLIIPNLIILSCNNKEEGKTRITIKSSTQPDSEVKLSSLFTIRTYLYGHSNPRGVNEFHSVDTLKFSEETDNDIKFIYSDTTDNKFLRQLRSRYELLTIIENCKTEFDKVKYLTHWTSIQWKHTSSNRPSRNDALTILDEARQGKRFRCVECSSVLCAALTAVGIKSRVLALKTKDVETKKYGAGHVVVEAYLNDLNKWIMADGQFNIIPANDNVPLNAVELQRALSNGENYTFISHNGKLRLKSIKRYQDFINEYLYYFDTSFDNRTDYENGRLQIKGKPKLMLVPIGAKNPELFEASTKIDYCLYTNSLIDFYQKP